MHTPRVVALLLLLYSGQDALAADAKQIFAVPKCSSLSLSDRRRCGQPGIPKQECLSRECCYEENSSGFPACFQRPDILECLALDPFMRIKCGTDPIMTEEKCRSLNCCYDNEVAGALESCFYPKGPCNAIVPWARIQCGETGTTRAACENAGCCFDNTLINVPICYKKII